jgi:hypothetical protein
MRVHRRFMSTRAAGLMALAATSAALLALPAVAAGPTVTLGVAVRLPGKAAKSSTLPLARPILVKITEINHSVAKSVVATALTMTLTRKGATVPNVPLTERTIRAAAVPARSTSTGSGRLAIAPGVIPGSGYHVTLCPKPNVKTSLRKSSAPACAVSKSFSLVAPEAPTLSAIAIKAAVGQTTTFPVTIHNVYGTSIGPMTLTIDGTGASAFSLVPGSDACAQSSGDCELKVAFSPTAPGTYDAKLTIAITGLAGTATTVTLRGTGV